MSQKNPPFHALYILDGQSGTTLISKKFTNRDYNDDLISGMFQALESFINHLAYSSKYEQIHEITFGDSIIVYDRVGYNNQNGSIMGVLIAKKGLSIKLLHNVLNTILCEFHEHYSPYLIHYAGNIRPFLEYEKQLDNIPELINIFSQTENRSFTDLHENNDQNLL